VMVFNRWGQNVYSSIGYGIPWDGTYRGARLPTATYYYIINLKNGLKALSGYVVIVR
jgi:gliding motility-associated-like protein